MNLIEFETILKKSWSRETSYYPNEWSESNPSYGQCAVSSLLINDYFGGDIVWSEVSLSNGEKISHYFNLIDGKQIDLTYSQFVEGTAVPAGVEKKKCFASTREFLMSDQDTNKRYKLLKENVDQLYLFTRGNEIHS